MPPTVPPTVPPPRTEPPFAELSYTDWTGPLDTADHRRLLALVEPLIATAETIDGRPALSDHLGIDLRHAGPRFRAVTATDPHGHVVGYAQRSSTNRSASIEAVIDPAARDSIEPLSTLVHRIADTSADTLADTAPVDATTRVNWWVHAPSEVAAQVASDLGFVERRRLLQMRRPLPTHMPVTIETRPFDPERDPDRWVEVNNRAFAGHDEQGGWTPADLRDRMRQPWFDPAGFLILDESSDSTDLAPPAMIGFCWTKVHPATRFDPPVGEIYVIAVDPSVAGRGLGRALTLAGLHHLAGAGMTVGMLHVDGGNEPAVRLYESLGFTVHSTSIAYAPAAAR